MINQWFLIGGLNNHRVIIFLSLVIILSSCSTNIPEYRTDKDVPLYIVKFKSESHKNCIIASHPIKENNLNNYDSMLGDYNYIFDTCCYQISHDQPDSFQQARNIYNYNPYHQLAGNYYLVDWRWQDYLPLSTEYLYLFAGPHRVSYNLLHHTVFLEYTWDSLDSLSQLWTPETNHEAAELEELRYVSCQAMERYIRGEKSPISFFDTINSNINSDINAYDYVIDNPYCHNFNKTSYLKYQSGGILAYKEYESVADSLYEVYIQALNEIIINNKLAKWTYEIIK